MVDVIAYATYAFVVTEAALDVGAAYNAYRLMKLTGAFKAWILMIVAVAIIAFQGLVTVLEIVLLYSEKEVEVLLGALNIWVYLYEIVPGLLLSFILFGAMYELHKTFKALK
jgi:hypothetical protein